MNVDRYLSALRRIQRHPHLWDQTKWCGTAYCLAGHAQLLSGKKSNKFDTASVKYDAADWLGVSWSVAHWLFRPERTIEDFQRVAIVQGWAKASQLQESLRG